MVSCSIDCLPEEKPKKRRNPRGNICRSPSLYGIMLTTLGTCMESGVLWYEKLRRDVCYAVRAGTKQPTVAGSMNQKMGRDLKPGSRQHDQPTAIQFTIISSPSL